MILSSQATTQISSLPSRERGLKSCFVDVNKIVSNVAPLAGAWIEIDRWHKDRMERLSLPSRERGLKLIRYSSGSIRRLSLPSRERGLKYPILDSLYLCLVAPLAGARIEILCRRVLLCLPGALPLAGAWIEIPASYGRLLQS